MVDGASDGGSGATLLAAESAGVKSARVLCVNRGGVGIFSSAISRRDVLIFFSILCYDVLDKRENKMRVGCVSYHVLPAASLALRNSLGLGERRAWVRTLSMECGVEAADTDDAGVRDGVFLLTGGVCSRDRASAL